MVKSGVKYVDRCKEEMKIVLRIDLMHLLR